MARNSYEQLAGRLALTVCLTSALVYSGSVPRQDASWKRFRSPGGNFCVDYPSKWLRGEVYEGSGLLFATGAKKHSRPYGEIDVSAFANGQDGLVPASFALGEDLEAHLSGLKRFVRVKNMEVLERRETELLGTAALEVKDRYTDPFDRSNWFEEIVLTRRGNTLYRIELECRAEQAARFDPVFTRVLSTFQFDCK